MRSVIATVLALGFASLSFADSGVVTRTELQRLLDSDVHEWRFQAGEVPGAQSPDFDDSHWAVVDIGHRWWPSDSTCWFRRRVTIPTRIHGIDVTGSTVRLKLGVDNGAKAYVDGRLKQEFQWSEGDILLAEDARPGQTFCVALHAVNGPGYGELIAARLVSSASEKMVDAVRSLLHDFDVALSDQRYGAGEQIPHWEGQVQRACQAIDLAAYRTARQESFLESIKRARVELLSDRSDLELRLRHTESKLAKLDALIKQGRHAGLQLAYRRAEARVIESFLQYARDDVADGVAAHTIRALKIATFLDRLCDRALKETADTLDNPSLDLRVPLYHTGQVAVGDGAFWQDGRPVFFTGVGHFSQVRQDTPILSQYGLNIIQIEIGPAEVLPEADTVNRQAIRDSVVRTLDEAARHDVAVNLLVSPHYFPQWALDRNPRLAECGHGFIKYCLEAPDAREVIEKFFRTLMPMIADHLALHSICLSNEPQYTGKCHYARARFRKWLRRKHGTIESLNQIYNTNYRRLADVPIPDNSSDYAQRFDWCRFNQDRFLEFHEFERDIIHQYDPDLPVHAKVQPHAFWHPGWFEVGVNHVAFNRIGSITGNDGWQMFVGDREGEYLQDWQEMAMNYTLQRSTAPLSPIFNSEDHIIADGDWRFIPASHIRTAFWTQALHGQGAATTWVWDRNQQGDLAENILTRPNCALALGQIGLDLNRLASQVVALQRARAPIAILYSYSSLPKSRDYGIEARSAFEGTYFADTTCDFVTQRQAVDGKLGDYRIVVVPRAAHAPDAVVAAFQRYLASGGTVVTVAECFTHNEYGRPRAARLRPSGRGQLVVYPDPLTPQAYRDILNQLLDRVGAVRPVRLVGEHGEAVWGVNLRAVRQNGNLLVALVNFSRQDRSICLKSRLPIVKAVNLLSNAEVAFPLVLAPLDPVLLTVPARMPGRDHSPDGE